MGGIAAGQTFTSFQNAKQILNAERGSLPDGLQNPNEAQWIAWSRQEDKAIRARLRQGGLDSMANLLLFGTSFTKQPRVRIEDLSAASKSGILRARVDDLIAGLRNPGDNERLAFLSGLLRGEGIDPLGDPLKTGRFIYNNLLRVLKEDRTFAERRAADAKHLTQPDAERDPASLLDRLSIFYDRGLSLDTGIFPNFAIEQALRDLKKRGVLREGQISRVAVIGPGLDFINKKEEAGYDYYPLQTLQPFALYDSLVRLGLAGGKALSVSILDISPRVIDHIRRARERAGRNIAYTIQLPHDIGRPWPAELDSYWRSLGDRVGTATAPIQPPKIFPGLETRAVKIRPDVVLACQPVDLDIVLQRLDLTEANRFDLIVATNIFVYYDRFEQALALENAGAMLKSGGLLLTNDRLPEVPGGAMHLAGLTEVRDESHRVLDAVGWYRRQ